MDDLDDFPTFLGRAGNLYGKKNLCPPFRLREIAEAWWLEGISLSHCIEQISIHLDENSCRYRCGSGDGGLGWLDQVIRKSWRLLQPRAKRERTDRLYKRGAAHEVVDDSADWFVDRTDKAPSTPKPTPLKPIDKAVAFLRRELADGEVETVLIEEDAKASGISLRTLDRARSRLRIVSRRSGFAKTGKSWLSLPVAP